eukprot:SAG11_NODE_2375_length_3441_cov_1.699282_1_plen_920_part_00
MESEQGEQVSVATDAVLLMTACDTDKRWWSGYLEGSDPSSQGTFLSKVVQLIEDDAGADGTGSEAETEPGDGGSGSAGDSMALQAVPQLRQGALTPEARQLAEVLRKVPGVGENELSRAVQAFEDDLRQLRRDFVRRNNDLATRLESGALTKQAAQAMQQAVELRENGFSGGNDLAEAQHAINVPVEHAKKSLGLRSVVGGSFRLKEKRQYGADEWWEMYARGEVLGARHPPTDVTPTKRTTQSQPEKPHSYSYDPYDRSYMVGEAVEVYSESAAQWERATVSSVSTEGGTITVSYGERSRTFDLKLPGLERKLRALTLGLPMLKRSYSKGDLVEVYSKTYGGWLPGTVTEVLGDERAQRELAVEYNDRTTIVNLMDGDLTRRFRLRLAPQHVNAVLALEAAASPSALTRLDISANRIGAEGAANLGRALRHATITTLLLANNELGEEGAASIAHALGANACITSINLRGNLISDYGLVALAGSLAKNRGLTCIDAAENDIGKKGAKALCAALGAGFLRALAALNLDGNPRLGRRGVAALAAALAHRVPPAVGGGGGAGLSSAGGVALALELGDTKCNAEGMEAVARRLLGGGSGALVHLNLEDNNIGVRGRRALCAALREGDTVLEILILYGNRLFGEAAAGQAAGGEAQSDVPEAAAVAAAAQQQQQSPLEGGWAELCEALARCEKLSCLDLGASGLPTAGAEALAALAAAPSSPLASVSLEANPSVDSRAASAAFAAAARGNRSLVTVRLGGSSLGFDGEALVEENDSLQGAGQVGDEGLGAALARNRERAVLHAALSAAAPVPAAGTVAAVGLGRRGSFLSAEVAVAAAGGGLQLVRAIQSASPGAKGGGGGRHVSTLDQERAAAEAAAQAKRLREEAEAAAARRQEEEAAAAAAAAAAERARSEAENGGVGVAG